jgi:hypothetical protein
MKLCSSRRRGGWTAFHRDAMLAPRSSARISPFRLAVAYRNTRPLATLAAQSHGRARRRPRLRARRRLSTMARRAARDALAVYDVVGIAGNRQRAPRQASWVFDGDRPRPTSRRCRGHPARNARQAGAEPLETPANVQLLDGGPRRARGDAQTGVLRSASFHFYDTDFAARAEGRAWPRHLADALTHASSGENWARYLGGARVYPDKWGD